MTSIIREIKKRSTESKRSKLHQTNSKAQSIMTFQINEHTLHGVEIGNVWTWSCESLPDCIKTINNFEPPAAMDVVMGVFTRFALGQA